MATLRRPSDGVEARLGTAVRLRDAAPRGGTRTVEYAIGVAGEGPNRATPALLPRAGGPPGRAPEVAAEQAATVRPCPST
jgi:hypothetical protein